MFAAGAALVGRHGGARRRGRAGVGDGGTTTVVKDWQRVAGCGDELGALLREHLLSPAPGVVQITASSEPTVQDGFPGAPFEAQAAQALGSGFVIDKAGHIVTNYHVVEGRLDQRSGVEPRHAQGVHR